MTQHAATGSVWRGVIEWVLGIAGAIAAFLGLFILIAEEEQSVGIGGDLSWRVGDIAPAWSYGLLIGGSALIVLALGLFFLGPHVSRTASRATERRDLLVHAGAFVVVNAFLWLQDYAIGGGIEYAYWVTIPWGIGLTGHTVAYLAGAGRRRTTGDLPPS
jgi:2TM domain